MFDEQGRRRPPTRVRVDHQLKALKTGRSKFEHSKTLSWDVVSWVGAHLEEVQEVLGQHLGDGGEFALSDLVPLVSIGGKRLRPRSADHSQSQGEDVRLG